MDDAGWARLHHGIDPRRVPLLTGWLRTTRWLARPLVRLRVRPVVLTVLGAALAVDALLLASRRPWLALVAVLLSVVCDALDGTVALLTSRDSPAGAAADKAADRIADTAFALVLWRCGAPWWLAVTAAVLSLGHEALRELRGGVLRARITVAERPTRVICAALGCGCAGVSAAAWPPTVCAVVWVGLALVGLVQLVLAS